MYFKNIPVLFLVILSVLFFDVSFVRAGGDENKAVKELVYKLLEETPQIKQKIRQIEQKVKNYTGLSGSLDFSKDSKNDTFLKLDKSNQSNQFQKSKAPFLKWELDADLDLNSAELNGELFRKYGDIKTSLNLGLEKGWSDEFDSRVYFKVEFEF